MIPKSVRRHLIKHFGKYILGAAGLGTAAGPVVVPPIIDAGKGAFSGPSVSDMDERYVKRSEFVELRDAMRANGLIAPDVVSISEVAEPGSLTCPANMIDENIRPYCAEK